MINSDDDHLAQQYEEEQESEVIQDPSADFDDNNAIHSGRGQQPDNDPNITNVAPVSAFDSQSHMEQKNVKIIDPKSKTNNADNVR